MYKKDESMRLCWVPFITMLPLIFLMGMDSPSSAQTNNPAPVEMMQFRPLSGGSGGDGTGPIGVKLEGADRFEVAWRLQDASPQHLYTANDSTAYYQSGGRWKSVLPSGEQLPVSSEAQLPPAVESVMPPNIQASGHSLSVLEEQRALWTYSLPKASQVRPDTLQYDAARYLYFQDNQGNWYSLDPDNGQERYKLTLSAPDEQLVCKAAPSGDAFCASPRLGVFSVREQTKAPHVIIDGKEQFFPQRPEILGGFTFVPLRSLFEAMQTQVHWNEETRTVTAVTGDRTISLTQDSPQALVDGKELQLEAPPVLYQGSLYVPLRFVGEALGATVLWEDATRVIQIIR